MQRHNVQEFNLTEARLFEQNIVSKIENVRHAFNKIQNTVESSQSWWKGGSEREFINDFMRTRTEMERFLKAWLEEYREIMNQVAAGYVEDEEYLKSDIMKQAFRDFEMSLGSGIPIAAGVSGAEVKRSGAGATAASSNTSVPRSQNPALIEEEAKKYVTGKPGDPGYHTALNEAKKGIKANWEKEEKAAAAAAKKEAARLQAIQNNIDTFMNQYQNGVDWTTINKSSSYGDAWECAGFATLAISQIHGKKFTYDEVKYSLPVELSDIQVGDYIRYRTGNYNHSVVVIAVDGEHITILDANRAGGAGNNLVGTKQFTWKELEDALDLNLIQTRSDNSNDTGYITRPQ